MSNTQPFEITTDLCTFAEKGVEQARSAFSTLIENTRKVTVTGRNSADTARTGSEAVFARGVELTEQNLAAGFDHAHQLVRSSSLKDALELQAAFARSQFATLQAQAKELVSLAQPAKA
jgi:phasin